MALKTLKKRAWQALRAKLDEQLSDIGILSKLRSTFEERFRYDDKGVPRVWKPDDDIDTAFRKARDQVCPNMRSSGVESLTIGLFVDS